MSRPSLRAVKVYDKGIVEGDRRNILCREGVTDKGYFLPRIKNMRILLYIVVFLSVVFIGDRLVSIAAMKIIQQSRNQFVLMYEGKNPANIIFLGDSRIDRNINIKEAEELTGKVCLNLGLGGNNIRISEILIKDFVQRYGDPEFVVIELGHSIVDPDSMAEMRIFSSYSKKMNELTQSIDPTFAMFELVFKSLRFNSPAFWRLSGEVFREPASRLLKNNIPSVLIDKWKNGGHVELPIYVKNMEALNRICHFAESKNIQIRLIISPYWKDYKRAIVNFTSWKSMLQKAAGRNHIYDYSSIFNEHPEYFNDTQHLNAAGAKKFVKILLKDNVF